jgi:hypothetical protein
MTGSDIDSNFHLLWQYANGSLPPDQFEACIESAKVGFDVANFLAIASSFTG